MTDTLCINLHPQTPWEERELTHWLHQPEWTLAIIDALIAEQVDHIQKYLPKEG